jgi:hypothetical protein
MPIHSFASRLRLGLCFVSFALLAPLACAAAPVTAGPSAAARPAPLLSTPLSTPPSAPADPDAPLDAKTRDQVVDVALATIADHYVDPAVAASLAASVRAHQKRGDYDQLTSSRAFAKLLSAHFAEVAHDAHLSIKYSARLLPPDGSASPDPAAAAAFEAAEQATNRYDNGGFDRVERLAGNIGYVKFNRFAGPWLAGDMVTAAMSFIADTDALIVDLRDNDGGYATMVPLIASYLFDGWPVQLSSIYWRTQGTTSGETSQAWTASFVPGKRFGKEKPVYILTSAKTVSAAEQFAYDLQALKRAKIIGETTMGGANPGNVFRVNEHFHMQVAQGRAINPVTKTNWEGTGVKPDVPVHADLALATARVLALEAQGSKLENPDRGAAPRPAEEKKELADATRDARLELERLHSAKTGATPSSR